MSLYTTRRGALSLLCAAPLALLVRDGRADDEALGGGWRPDFQASNTDPETKKWITTAQSKLGGNCCEWADGFRLGQSYKFDRTVEGGQQTVWKVALKEWQTGSDGFYHARVWDYLQTGQYVWLKAEYDAFAPGNPTGNPIVWIGINWETKQLQVRCYGGDTGA